MARTSRQKFYIGAFALQPNSMLAAVGAAAEHEVVRRTTIVSAWSFEVLKVCRRIPGSTRVKPKQLAVRVLRVILGLFFVLDGVIKLTGISKTVQLFERIGWGQWFRYLTGSIVLVGGALILLRLRWTFLGAVLCACTVGTGALLYAFNLHRDPTLPAVITFFTVTLAVLAYSERKR
jgi:uncharacterized membrane protein YphA (DoxX/SURF4 family)